MAAAAALNRLLPLVLLAAVVGRHGASGDGGFPIVFTETKCTPAPTSRTVQVHSLAQCMPDRPAASCARCVQESARELGKCCWNMQSGGVATVIGYNCHLRLDVSVPMTPQFDRSRHRECDCLRHSDDLPGHVRGNVAAVKAAQIVPTQYADQRIAV
uniref:Gnk2-homologous domain-containing protein n=1 Tax=Oryza barthii TaxID=65489 RepID=A0A0D3FH27_9ORYZ